MNEAKEESERIKAQGLTPSLLALRGRWRAPRDTDRPWKLRTAPGSQTARKWDLSSAATSGEL